jgi:hypothetical protein
MNRRDLALGAGLLTLASWVPALAAPLPVEPGNRRAAIQRLDVVNSVRLNEVGVPVTISTMTLVYEDGVEEKITDARVMRFVLKRFRKQMAEDTTRTYTIQSSPDFPL